MRTLIRVSVLVLCVTGLIQAQTNCKAIGQKNPMGMDMQVMSPVTVGDTGTFGVTCVKTLPFAMKTADTIFFNVCFKVMDGKMHSSQIRYNTSMGAVTYNFSLLAPNASGVESKEVAAVRLFALFPNPTSNVLNIAMPLAPAGAKAELYSVTGQRIAEQVVSANGNITLFIGDQPNGVYCLRIISNGKIVAQDRVTVAR